MKLLLAPVQIPLKVAGRAARLGLQAAEGLVERVVGQEAPPAPPARPAPAPAAGGNGASAAPAPPKPKPGPAAETPKPARPATRPKPKPAAKPRPKNAPRAKAAPPPPPEAAPQNVPHDPPDGTRVDRVPTGGTPVSPTAPADEDDVVYSAGPERDVAATIHVEAPFDDYDKLSAQDLVARLRTADDATKAAVALYEGSSRKRKSVLAAAGMEV
jgi:outer membrane biosynthesis protein TonB